MSTKTPKKTSEIQHNNNNNSNNLRGFYTPPPKWRSEPQISSRNSMTDEKRKTNYHHHHTSLSPDSNLYHILHKVPSGDSPYVKAKHVQLIEKDPSKAVALFWNAINSGDRIDSALKDMAVVMKQLDRSNEAIEAIRSFRHLCSSDSQESLDNVLLELYKHSGRLEEQIEVLRLKLKRVEEGNTFDRKKVKLARCHGKKVHITVEQEYARLLGNLAWAYLQRNDYGTAEEYYRKALSIEPDRNKQCNLAICLMCTNRITEAKMLLQVIRDSCPEGQMMDESYGKSFERAFEMLAEIETQPDKFSVEAEKENCCGSPNKVPYESSQCNSRRVLDDQLDLKGRAYSSVDYFAKYNAVKRTNTPSCQQQRIPKSPLTQPKRNVSLSDSGKWRKQTHNDGPVNCFPRRLHFDNPADSNHLHTRDLKSNSEPEQHCRMNTSMSTDSTLQKNVSTHVDRNNNWPPTDLSAAVEGRDSCRADKECVSSSYKVKKSWADMVEEDEQEMMNDLFSKENVDLNLLENLNKKYQSMSFHANGEISSKQSSACRSLIYNQQQPLNCKATNRLQVFQDITPESPNA